MNTYSVCKGEISGDDPDHALLPKKRTPKENFFLGIGLLGVAFSTIASICSAIPYH